MIHHLFPPKLNYVSICFISLFGGCKNEIVSIRTLMPAINVDLHRVCISLQKAILYKFPPSLKQSDAKTPVQEKWNEEKLKTIFSVRQHSDYMLSFKTS